MTQKDINNWIMYHEIHHLSRMGFTPTKIARHLVCDRRTVKAYLEMSEQDYGQRLINEQERTKILSAYEDFVRDKLTLYSDTSAAQMHDWLKESHPDLPKVSERSVYNFVLFVRQKHNIPLVSITREYFPVEELPYGDQAQVDFGEYNMRLPNGGRKKVKFFAMVLSRSRMKFIWFTSQSFTAEMVCEAHEKAFAFFRGIPKTIVYDQDRTMLVDENMGDLILTSYFKQYTKSRSFKLHFCKKADPESKGKIENVIQYVKKNFLYNRAYYEIETLNIEAINWLSRTANALNHNYTKKPPESEFMIEVNFLTPYVPLTIVKKESKMYYVRKTNTIAYKSNFYSLPMGSYQGQNTKVKVKEINASIEISNLQDEIICTHQLSQLTGQTIINTNHKRDTSKSMDEMMTHITTRFTNTVMAMEYLQCIKKEHPRYTRDHLHAIEKAFEITDADLSLADTTLNFCIKNELFSGTEFVQVLLVFMSESDYIKKMGKPLVLLDKKNLEKANQIPAKSNIEDYENIINPINYSS